MIDPLNLPRNLPSSRAIIPLGKSASFVTQIIFVSALTYCAGSRTKSKASSGVTPRATVDPSPLTIRCSRDHLFELSAQYSSAAEVAMGEEETPSERGDNAETDHDAIRRPVRMHRRRGRHLVEQGCVEEPPPAASDPAHHLDDQR